MWCEVMVAGSGGGVVMLCRQCGSVADVEAGIALSTTAPNGSIDSSSTFTFHSQHIAK